MQQRTRRLADLAGLVVFAAGFVVIGVLFLGPTVQLSLDEAVCLSATGPDSPYLQSPCPPEVIPTQGSDSAVIRVELAGGSPGWIEGGFFYMRASTETDEVVLEQQLESDGTTYLPPGRYEFTFYGRSCDGNCGYLDPPSFGCTTAIDVSANEKLTIAYDWTIPTCEVVDPMATPNNGGVVYQCTGGVYINDPGNALCERDGQFQIDHAYVPPDVEPVMVSLVGAYEQFDLLPTTTPCIHSAFVTWNDGEKTGWVNHDSCPEPGSPPFLGGPPPETLGAAVEGDFFSADGGPWQMEGVCAAAAGTIFQGGVWTEVRAALEFPVSAPSDDTPSTSATLSLRHATGNPSEPIAIYGYPGDGAMEAADVMVTGVPITFTSTPPVYEHHDVTALLTPEVFAAGWAGFSLRAEPPVFEGSGSGHDFADCQGDVQFPILTIESLTRDPDEDGDGVADANDVCPDTMPDAFPELFETRYRYDGTVLVSAYGPYPPHTVQETGGCSAGQIVAVKGLGPLHERYGLGHDALEAWIADH